MSIAKGLLAGAGCIAMQIPYTLNGPSKMDGAVGTALSKIVPFESEIDYTGYKEHWWWDNLAHYLGGYAFGSVASLLFSERETVLKAFLLVAGGWETFEYYGEERPWHTDESGERVWEFDHAMEDTLLDTLMGAAGAYRAAKDR